MKIARSAVLICIFSGSLVGIAPEQEQVLHAGPIDAKAGSSRTIQNPFDPWKMEWESYPYKRFYPSTSESVWFWMHRTPDGIPGGQKLPFEEGKRPSVQAREAFVIRFFEMPDVKDHTRKTWSRWPAALDGKWEEFDVLRMDVEFPTDAHVWWALEDKFIQPPVVGNFDVKGGTPATLELDLKQAVADRGLDLKNIWRTWVRHDLSKGTSRFKNIRLSRRDAAASLPLLRDPEATKLPDHPAARKAPEPDVPQDLTPLFGPRTIVFKNAAPLLLHSNLDRRAGAGVTYDARRMMLLLFEGQRYGTIKDGGRPEGFAVQTLDGGETWTGLQGDPERTWLLPTTGLQSEGVDSKGTFIFHAEEGCGNDPGPRHRMSVFHFAGKDGWTFNRKMFVFEEEGRQCSHYGKNWVDFLRAPSGRLWTAIRILGREWPDWRAVHVKYSDNEGQSWHSWREGFKASIPGTHTEKGYPYPRLAPYGDHVAVFMKVEREDETDQWTHFDGKSWALLEKLPIGVTSAISLGPKEILAAGPGGAIRLADGKWVKELEQDPGTLVQSGENVLAIGTGAGKVKDEIHVRYRGPEGKWSEPQVHKTGAIQEMHVPRYVPGNLGAVLYIAGEDKTSAKVLLVPSRLQ